jgi:DNA modification methylase
MKHQVLIGNCAEILMTLPSESVDCVVTSPPYWGLRDYKTEPVEWPDGWRGQLGLEPTPQLYIEHLVSIFDEVKRVLKKTGTCWVNLGDSYAGSWGNYGARGGKQRPRKVERFDRPGAPPHDMLPPTVNCGIAEKCLVQIPSRFAIAMTDAGWILRNEIIWHKPNAMPSSVKDRFTVDFEKLFFFTKSKKYYFEQQFEPMSEATKERDQYRFGGAFLSQFTGSPTEKRYQNTGRPIEEPHFYNEKGRNKRTVWTITTKPYKGAHFAVFPPELVETPIKAGCPVGGVVLDPFGGSGTTAAVAKQLGRNSIMIELNPNYIPLMEKRVGEPDVKIVDMLGGAEA